MDKAPSSVRTIGDRTQAWRRATVPTLLFTVSVILAEAVGFDMQIPWEQFQYLDRTILESNPLGALLLLHCQPPALNALIAVFVKVGLVLGCDPNLVAKVCFTAVGLATTVGFHALVLRLTGSKILAALACLSLVADPAFHFYANEAWYPHLLLAGMILFAHFAERLFVTGERRYLWRVLAVVALLCLTRSLFHPIWAAATAVLVAVLYARRFPEAAGGVRGLVVPIAITLLALAVWPVKNRVIFGEATYSSWEGINLTSTLPIKRPLWGAYLGRGEVPPATAKRVQAFEARYGEELAEVVSATTKSDGARNWNHLINFEIGPELKRKAIHWRLDHPAEWAFLAAVQYPMWARGAYILSYTDEPRGPKNPVYQTYARLYRDVFFTDVRGLVEPLAPGWRLHKTTILPANKTKLDYSLFGLVWFPLIVLLALVELLRRSPPSTARGALILVCLFQIAWTLVVPCLTMGIEGNRMRYSTSGLFVLLVAMLAHGWLERWRARTSHATREPSSAPRT